LRTRSRSRGISRPGQTPSATRLEALFRVRNPVFAPRCGTDRHLRIRRGTNCHLRIRGGTDRHLRTRTRARVSAARRLSTPGRAVQSPAKLHARAGVVRRRPRVWSAIITGAGGGFLFYVASAPKKAPSLAPDTINALRLSSCLGGGGKVPSSYFCAAIAGVAFKRTSRGNTSTQQHEMSYSQKPPASGKVA